MSVDRRSLLKTTAAATVVGGPFAGLVNAPAEALRPPGTVTLVPIPDERDGAVRLHLPKGFHYRSFHDTEFPVVLDDGTALPGRHDGMGAFRGPRGNVILVRNHEVTNNPNTPAFGPGTPYDPGAGAGTTTIEVTKRGEVQRAFTSLNGTMFNCSGGIMPWGSWITCEETINGPDVGPDFTGASNLGLQKPHGYVFEVPKDGQSNREPITHAGRFPHEAVSFDPVDGILYLTEDNFEFPSGFYRYLPPNDAMKDGRIEDGGRLQMLAVKGRPNIHLEERQPARASYKVEWVDIEEPNPTFPYTPGEEAPTTNDAALVAVGDQGRAQGAALFSRLEGQVYDDGVIYFTSTQGGGPIEDDTDDDNANGFGNGNGQVWAYHCRKRRLEVIYQAPVDDAEANQTFDFPDNITTSKRGTLVVCEDSTVDNYIRGLTRRGRLWDIALNRLYSQIATVPGTTDPLPRFGDEFAGSTFSPDGHTLFVNIQASRGMTFAIWGPWGRIGV
ncbi:PhoX family protein [Nocardioides sp. GXQ0305]|uniref:PhoX family protein n=1 Tax=Nocardioides sp. GXQ0305 TaxID=3423912 RepID=UPI003D7E9103